MKIKRLQTCVDTHDTTLVTKADAVRIERCIDMLDAKLDRVEIRVEARFEKELSPLRTDMAIAKWMLGIIVGGVIMLVLKAFFPA